MTHVFTYGSLMFTEVWSRVVEGTYAGVPAALDGHARFAIRDETYPGMVAQPDATVDGVLYLDVGDDDLERLDRFEGDDYRRAVVQVRCGDGARREAGTYVYLPTDRLLPAAWSPDAFALRRFLDTYCRDQLDR